jgi:hypothetical protein
MAICYTRGVALHVFAWIQRQCVIKTPNGELLDDLPSKYMVQLLDALLAYKSKADKQKVETQRRTPLLSLDVEGPGFQCGPM